MHKSSLLLIALLLSSFTSLVAQENSPYTRYGLGLLQQDGNVSNRGMGGASLADRSNTLINPQNPSSYSALKLTSYQLGLSGSSFNIQSRNSANRTGGFGLSYVNLAFPVAKRTAVSFGLLPYSQVKYNLQAIDTVPSISEVQKDYVGSGSLQRVYLGAAHEYKGFSLGFNASYLFGNYQNNLSQSFTDSLDILSTDVLRRNTLGGLMWELGASYHYKIKEEKYFNVGATFSNRANINTTAESYSFSSIGSVSSGIYSYRVDSTVGKRGKTVLPSNLGLGVQLGNGDYWKVGADYRRSDWSSFRSFEVADSFANSSSIRFGGEITPDINDKFNVWKRVAYRLGGYYENMPLRLNNTQLSAMGVTAGVGYPIRRTLRSIGQINASFELGRRGTLDNGLIRESFSRFTIGVTVNDRWFLKRRYD
jgi:long-subunit fatty acid transport protein